jgi:hypothetical protein
LKDMIGTRQSMEVVVNQNKLEPQLKWSSAAPADSDCDWDVSSDATTKWIPSTPGDLSSSIVHKRE